MPRNFTWIIKDRLAISERPGGYAPNHRRVRRQEELLWLRAQQFDRVVSMLSSSHNLHAYDEFHLAWSHYPFSAGDPEPVLASLYPALSNWLKTGERVLIHQDELSDRLMGVIAGYLRWSGILPDRPRAITVVEQLMKRQMGSAGRTIVGLVETLPGAAPTSSVDVAAEDNSDSPGAVAGPSTGSTASSADSTAASADSTAASADSKARSADSTARSADSTARSSDSTARSSGTPARPKRSGTAASPASGQGERKSGPAASSQEKSAKP